MCRVLEDRASGDKRAKLRKLIDRGRRYELQVMQERGGGAGSAPQFNNTRKRHMTTLVVRVQQKCPAVAVLWLCYGCVVAVA